MTVVRKDQQNNNKLRLLQTAIEDGLTSGVSDRSVQDIMQDVQTKLGLND